MRSARVQRKLAKGKVFEPFNHFIIGYRTLALNFAYRKRRAVFGRTVDKRVDRAFVLL